MPSGNLTPRVPSYRRHKPSGQAVVTLNGKDRYLGKWNTKASRVEFNRLVGAWLTGGGTLPFDADSGLTVAELVLAYWKHACSYYRKDGRPTGTLASIRVALRILRKSYGSTPVAQFGPRALKALQLKMIEMGQRRIRGALRLSTPKHNS